MVVHPFILIHLEFVHQQYVGLCFWFRIFGEFSKKMIHTQSWKFWKKWFWTTYNNAAIQTSPVWWSFISENPAVCCQNTSLYKSWLWKLLIFFRFLWSMVSFRSYAYVDESFLGAFNFSPLDEVWKIWVWGPTKLGFGAPNKLGPEKKEKDDGVEAELSKGLRDNGGQYLKNTLFPEGRRVALPHFVEKSGHHPRLGPH